MKMIFKQVKVLILAVCMLVGTFTGIIFKSETTYAMTTQSEAVQWARNQVGSRYENGYGVQCVELFRQYCNHIGLGYPKNWWCPNDLPSKAEIPTGWNKLKGVRVQPGDVAIWTNAYTGHVAIVLSSNGDSFEVIDQNGNNNFDPGTIRTKSYRDGYWGVLRPNFNPDSPPVERGSRMETGYSRTIADGDYHIVSALDTDPTSIWRQCVTIAGYPPSKENGGNSQLYGCSEEAYQVFTVTWRGNGFYEIKLKYSGKCLDVAGGDTANATNIQQWEDNDTDAQQWAIKEADDGIGHTVQTRCSGYYLDVTGGVCANETNIQVYKDIGKTNHSQQWLFIPWNGGDSAKQEVPDGEYEIVTKLDNSKSLQALDHEVVNGTNIVLQERDENNKTSFHIQYLGKGYYRITEKNSGLCLDVSGGYSKSGTNVQLWTPNETDAQQWILKACEDGSFNIISKKATYLDLTGAHTENGTNVAAFNGHGEDNQAWYLLPVEEKQPENETPSTTPVPTAASEVTQAPTATPVPTAASAVTQAPTATPVPTVASAVTQAPTVTPVPTATSAVTQAPTATPVPTATPAVTQEMTTTSVPTVAPTNTEPVVAENLKIFSVKCKRNTKKITGKVSVSKATVKIKVGRKVYKRAVVKGKKFKLKLNYKLKKRTKITIKVTKKNYKSLIKRYVVK